MLTLTQFLEQKRTQILPKGELVAHSHLHNLRWLFPNNEFMYVRMYINAVLQKEDALIKIDDFFVLTINECEYICDTLTDVCNVYQIILGTVKNYLRCISITVNSNNDCEYFAAYKANLQSLLTFGKTLTI